MAHPLEDTLIAKQIAPTAMRLLVLDVLQQHPAALSLADVEVLLNHADRITVHRIEDGSGAVKYALCEPACTPMQHHDLHVHFFCTQCHETSCLPTVAVPIIALPGAYRVQETSLVMKGLCERCASPPPTMQ